MAITGKFIADFESFYGAVQKAEVSLRSFEGNAGKVEKSLNRMVDSFSGRQIIQEATLAAEAVQRIGGASKLTESELASVTSTANEAAAKLRALGQNVPENIDRLTTSTKKTGDAMSNAARSIRDVDGVLGAVGVKTGPLVKVFDDLGAASGKTAGELGKVGTAGLALGAGIAGWQIGRAISEFLGLDRVIGDVTAKLLGFGDVAAQEAGAGADVLARASKNAGRSITDMAEAMRINQAAAEAAIARNKGLSDAFVEGKKKEQAAFDASAEAAKRWAETLNAAFRKWSGADLAEQVKILDITFRRMADSGKITEKQLRDMAAEAAKLAEKGAILSPRLWDIVLATGELDPNLTSDAEAFGKLGTQIDLVIPKLSAFNQGVLDLQAKTVTGFDGLKDLGVKVGSGFDTAIVKTKQETDQIGELARAFSQLSQIAGGSLGAIIGSFGTVIGAIDTAKKSMESLKSGFSKGFSLSGILESTSGILGLASAAIAAGKAIANLFNRSKGRDLVEDFADTFGGFDALHAQLNELGAEGERLWIALTQGVGKNNPQQAQAAIDAITKALQKKADASEESVVMSEEEAQATIETAAAAAKALDDVNERLKVNREAWSDWSADVTGFLQKLADEIRRMPIPGPTGATGGPGGGSYYRTPTGGGGGRAGSVTVPVYLDGKVLTTVVARNLPVVLRQHGVVG